MHYDNHWDWISHRAERRRHEKTPNWLSVRGCLNRCVFRSCRWNWIFVRAFNWTMFVHVRQWNIYRTSNTFKHMRYSTLSKPFLCLYQLRQQQQSIAGPHIKRWFHRSTNASNRDQSTAKRRNKNNKKQCLCLAYLQRNGDGSCSTPMAEPTRIKIADQHTRTFLSAVGRCFLFLPSTCDNAIRDYGGFNHVQQRYAEAVLHTFCNTKSHIEWNATQKHLHTFTHTHTDSLANNNINRPLERSSIQWITASFRNNCSTYFWNLTKKNRQNDHNKILFGTKYTRETNINKERNATKPYKNTVSQYYCADCWFVTFRGDVHTHIRILWSVCACVCGLHYRQSWCHCRWVGYVCRDLNLKHQPQLKMVCGADKLLLWGEFEGSLIVHCLNFCLRNRYVFSSRKWREWVELKSVFVYENNISIIIVWMRHVTFLFRLQCSRIHHTERFRQYKRNNRLFSQWI